MKEIISDNYSVWIGDNSLSKLDVTSYSKIAVLVDENTKRDCLSKLPNFENSIILILGKGIEQYQTIKNKKVPHSDIKIVENYINEN